MDFGSELENLAEESNTADTTKHAVELNYHSLQNGSVAPFGTQKHIKVLTFCMFGLQLIAPCCALLEQVSFLVQLSTAALGLVGTLSTHLWNTTARNSYCVSGVSSL